MNQIVAVVLACALLGEEVTAQMAVAGAAVLISVAVIVRWSGASVEPGRGLLTKRRSIAVSAASEPTAWRAAHWGGERCG